MIRTFAAAGGLSLAGLAALAAANDAAAQTWGQPIYVSPYGHVVGGTPLSEVETRSYVTTGRWADGYAGQAWVYVPAPIHGSRYSHGHGYEQSYGYGYGHGYAGSHGRSHWRGHGPRPAPGYRDLWGYNDDRPPAARRERRSRYHGRDCGCGDVYLYDR